MKFKRGDLVTIHDPELIGKVYKIQSMDNSIGVKQRYAYFSNGNFCNVDNLSLFQKTTQKTTQEVFIDKCKKVMNVK